jgi:hypothetical protein
MRIWSLHPKYLDTKGLVALWRETLLAKSVLSGETKGYKSHPQLERFKAHSDPLNAINAYLDEVWKEAQLRGYHFNRDKIDCPDKKMSIPVTEGQIKYEVQHLLGKLKIRDQKKFDELSKAKVIEAHPLFTVVKGGIEKWEKAANS